MNFQKKNRTINNDRCNLNPIYAKQNLDTISKICNKKNGVVVNYFITLNPGILIGLVSLPDTTFIIECINSRSKSFTINYNNNEIFHSFIFKNDLKKSKKTGYSLYEMYFLKIDSILKKRNINDVTIIPAGHSHILNFDFLQSDTIPTKSIYQSALINRYKFTYSTSADFLINGNSSLKNYDRINLLAPVYNSNAYIALTSTAKLINELNKSFDINKIEKNNITTFFEKDKLIQFIGHAKTNSSSINQQIILSDTSNINSNAILKNDLSGSSYLLNGCNSNLGKQEQYNTINSLPYQLMNQHASAVISSLWPIDDKENAEFLAKFYEFMALGISSSDALYKTKFYFANNNYSPSMWGAYIYYGSDFYLSKKNILNEYLYVILIILFCGLAVFVVFIKRKFKKQTD